MDKIELEIIALAEGKDENYVVILEEVIGNRRLPIIIGPFEAQAIVIVLEKMKHRRPLTHDLFKNTLEHAGVTITEVLISALKDDIFYALLVGRQQNGKPFNVDARSSDAIALAVRFGCPIFTTEKIMADAGVDIEVVEENKPEPALADRSKEDLEGMLQEALDREDYESAAKIRDILDQKD